ncbi:MAG: uracil-DNA glycosylase [Bacteriovoracia bacterium]
MSLDPSWMPHLSEALALPRVQECLQFVEQERKSKTIYPAATDVFRAFAACPFERVKVVILGQDPYHGEGQAHGLSFSVKRGVKLPPSLVNIFKELKSDVSVDTPTHGDLTRWAEQGVLLLNTVLTVEHGKAASHQARGWELFTDHVIDVLNTKKEHLVFILWGAPAQKKAEKVDRTRHMVLKSVHPSPLSSYRGFFGSKPFSQTNAYLQSKGMAPIDWNLA